MVAAVNVVIVGGHGKIALRLEKILAERGDSPRGIVRKTEQAADLEEIGAEPVVVDVENESADALAEHVRGSDAVVFAAGAGPGSGSERKRTVDYGAAVKLIEACEGTGVDRYAIVSAMGVDRESYPESMKPYYEAKRDADDALRASSLAYTIVRPGALTDGVGSGRCGTGGTVTDRNLGQAASFVCRSAQRTRAAIASSMGVSPLRRSNVSPAVRGSASTAASVAATSSRGTDGPPPSSGCPAAMRPLPTPSVSAPGRTMV